MSIEFRLFYQCQTSVMLVIWLSFSNKWGMSSQAQCNSLTPVCMAQPGTRPTTPSPTKRSGSDTALPSHLSLLTLVQSFIPLLQMLVVVKWWTFTRCHVPWQLKSPVEACLRKHKTHSSLTWRLRSTKIIETEEKKNGLWFSVPLLAFSYLKETHLSPSILKTSPMHDSYSVQS